MHYFHNSTRVWAYVEHDGWSWDDVVAKAPEEDPSLDDTLDPTKEGPLQRVG